MVRILHEEDAFAPLLIRGEGGIAHANDWALGFMRGVRLHYKSWRELFDGTPAFKAEAQLRSLGAQMAEYFCNP